MKYVSFIYLFIFFFFFFFRKTGFDNGDNLHGMSNPIFWEKGEKYRQIICPDSREVHKRGNLIKCDLLENLHLSPVAIRIHQAHCFFVFFVVVFFVCLFFYLFCFFICLCFFFFFFFLSLFTICFFLSLFTMCLLVTGNRQI